MGYFWFQVQDDINELINGLSSISIEKYRRQALGNYPMLLIWTHVSLVGRAEKAQTCAKRGTVGR